MNVDTYPTTYIRVNSRWSIGSIKKLTNKLLDLIRKYLQNIR